MGKTKKNGLIGRKKYNNAKKKMCIQNLIKEKKPSIKRKKILKLNEKNTFFITSPNQKSVFIVSTDQGNGFIAPSNIKKKICKLFIENGTVYLEKINKNDKNIKCYACNKNIDKDLHSYELCNICNKHYHCGCISYDLGDYICNDCNEIDE